MRGGGTANLVLVAEGADDALEGTLRFLLSGRSAYVSGQVFHLAEPVAPVQAPADWDAPLAGKVAVVTGAARGIGAAIATTFAAEGATVLPTIDGALENPGKGGPANPVKGNKGTAGKATEGGKSSS